MRFRVDVRGQALQLGAILLLGIAVLALAIVQTTAVPADNKKVEFRSYLDASADMADFHNSIITTGSGGQNQRTSVRTGTTYPSRLVLLNPPPAAGRITTSNQQSIQFKNVSTVNGEPANVQQFWSGTVEGEYTTRSIRFTPRYNELRASPVAVDSAGAYRLADQSTIGITSQSVVSKNGQTITLVTVDGNLSAGGVSTPVAAAPVSVTTRSVTITGNNSQANDPQAVLPVAGNASRWANSSVGEEIERNVKDLTVTNSTHVAITLDGTETYELRLAKVSVRSVNGDTTVENPEPAYVVPVDETRTTSSNQSVDVAAEVRDKYNNPITTGATVNYSIVDGNGVFVNSTGAVGSTASVTTNSEGRAPIQFEPSTPTADVQAEISGPSAPFNTTTFTVTAIGDGSGGSGGDRALASGDASGLILLESSSASPQDDEVTLRLNNTGTSSINITGVRLGFATTFENNSDVEDGSNEITDVVAETQSGQDRSGLAAFEGGAPVFFNSPIQLQSKTPTNFTFVLSPSYDTGGSQGNQGQGNQGQGNQGQGNQGQGNQGQGNRDTLAFSVTLYIEGGFAAEYTVYLNFNS